MSGEVETKYQIPKKHWNDYSVDELRVYILKNRKKTDCTFVVADQEDGKERKVFESFKWILCDMSPVLTEILNDVKNQAKNWIEIIVPDPKYIEAILCYGHTKVVDTKIINLVDFYGASKQYQVKSLEDEVIKMFESEENQKKADCVKLFWLSYVKYPEDQQMRAIFNQVVKHLTHTDEVAVADIDFILKFDEEIFDVFLDRIMVNPNLRVIAFKIMEAYLIKHLFDGDKDKPIEALRKIDRGLVDSYVDKLQLWKLKLKYLKPLLSSKLFDKSGKIKLLNEYRKYIIPLKLPTSPVDEYLEQVGNV